MGLVKAPGRGRGEGQIDPVADAMLLEEGIGQEEKLQRRHGALDGHLGDVEHQPPTLPGAQEVVQGDRAIGRVEVEDALAPLLLHQARRLLRHDARAGGDDQVVIGEHPAILSQRNLVLLRLDQLNRGDDHFHAARQIVALGAHDVGLAVGAEGDEQETGLIVVYFVLVDDGDLPLAHVEGIDQPIGDHGAGRTGAQNQKTFHAESPQKLLRVTWCVLRARSVRIGAARNTHHVTCTSSYPRQLSNAAQLAEEHVAFHDDVGDDVSDALNVAQHLLLLCGRQREDFADMGADHILRYIQVFGQPGDFALVRAAIVWEQCRRPSPWLSIRCPRAPAHGPGAAPCDRAPALAEGSGVWPKLPSPLRTGAGLGARFRSGCRSRMGG